MKFNKSKKNDLNLKSLEKLAILVKLDDFNHSYSCANIFIHKSTKLRYDLPVWLPQSESVDTTTKTDTAK